MSLVLEKCDSGHVQLQPLKPLPLLPLQAPWVPGVGLSVPVLPDCRFLQLQEMTAGGCKGSGAREVRQRFIKTPNLAAETDCLRHAELSYRSWLALSAVTC